MLNRGRQWETLTWTGIANRIYATSDAVVRIATDHAEAVEDARTESVAAPIAELAASARIDAATATEIERWIGALRPAVAATTDHCSLHNDIHDMNVICRRRGSVLAIIDWGDAGWGDPALEFAQVPLAAVPFVMTGYESEAVDLLGDPPEARVIWDKLDYALHAVHDDRRLLDELTHFVRTADDRWRRVTR